MTVKKQIAIIGAGNMAEALVAGMLKAGVAKPKQLYATDILPERRTQLQSRYQVKTGIDNREAAAWGDVLILAVEPQIIDEVIQLTAQSIKKDSLVISVAAGYPIGNLAQHLPPGARIIRAMPNTPSSVGAGVTALALGPGVTKEDREMAEAISGSVGTVVTIEERLMDAVTGLSGSGPAYAYLIIEALADGGVKAGLPRQTAQLLAAQTVLGAARMVIESGEHPAVLKDRVASPGGTTIAGLHQLEEGRLRATLINAVEAACKRSKELGADPRD
ncbi:MAG: pyrroline-5-carboxylate reductase [Nitrospirae bacterium]|nr:MAG: pyrroline-5-carboxylate reductase [Nitrospirota bacterium]